MIIVQIMNLWKVIPQHRKRPWPILGFPQVATTAAATPCRQAHMVGAPRLTRFGGASGPEAMIDDFATPVWANSHERFSADVAAGLGRLARWLRRRGDDHDASGKSERANSTS